MKKIKIGIIGMGTTGLSAAQQLMDLYEQSQSVQSTIDVHLFDIANKVDGAGGQVKSYHDPETKMTSELGAVIIFPSWQKINMLLRRYNIETKTAPFVMQRFAIDGKKAPPLISSRNFLAFIFQMNNYRRLCGRADYKEFFIHGNHKAPAELLTTVQDWAEKNNILLVVKLFQEFYSGCGYGQNIWEQPALYVVQLMTFEVVMELVKNAFKLHNVKSVVDGYQRLWTTIADDLKKNKNCHFHYGAEVTRVTQKYNTFKQCVYEINFNNSSMDVDRVIFTNAPSNITNVFKTAFQDPMFDLLIETLRQSSSANYQVVIAQLTYRNALHFKLPSTRFFYESYHSRADIKFSPVLDIMMDGEEQQGREGNTVNHMLYFYGDKDGASISQQTVAAKLKEYGCEVTTIKCMKNWNDYNQHFPIPALKAGAAQILHSYNATHGAQIVGSITAMGYTEATVAQGMLAAQRIFSNF